MSDNDAHKKNLLPVVPWSAPGEWEEVNTSIRFLINNHNKRIDDLKYRAGRAKELLEATFALQDEICGKTCRHCPEPCCSVANPWFDLKDLLFLHLLKRDVPPFQPRDKHTKTCRYYTISKGCTLDRLSRPWICNYYLCPSQMANFRKNNLQDLEFMRSVFHQVKNERLMMENSFIDVTSGTGGVFALSCTKPATTMAT